MIMDKSLHVQHGQNRNMQKYCNQKKDLYRSLEEFISSIALSLSERLSPSLSRALFFSLHCGSFKILIATILTFWIRFFFSFRSIHIHEKIYFVQYIGNSGNANNNIILEYAIGQTEYTHAIHLIINYHHNSLGISILILMQIKSSNGFINIIGRYIEPKIIFK